MLSSEVVIASNIQRRVEHLQGLLDDAANDTEGRRISMSLVEAIGKAQNDYHQSVGRQNKLLNDLKEKRSDRLKNQIKENASIINLVQLWKEEESRKKLIQLAELRKQVVKDEVKNISSMDEVKARILGISEDEVLEDDLKKEKIIYVHINKTVGSSIGIAFNNQQPVYQHLPFREYCKNMILKNISL